jgi:recombination protein RecR
MSLPKSVKNLSDSLSSLPGIGPRLSIKLALNLAIKNRELSRRIKNALISVYENVTLCADCFNLCENNTHCEICLDRERDYTKLFVVETPIDLYTIEDSGSYKGLYHVVGGVISPVNSIGPEDLTIQNLIKRLNNCNFDEIILGLGATNEAESTNAYIKLLIEKESVNIKTTVLAKGIPVGGSIEYMSLQTIKDAFNRRAII